MPREGHDGLCIPTSTARAIFQSTCPARGTTSLQSTDISRAPFQSTCPARGTTLFNGVDFAPPPISIHVPREGHDVCCGGMCIYAHKFQSTCPARGTTASCIKIYYIFVDFNPRAPRGARLSHANGLNFLTDFNPRAPRGARRNYTARRDCPYLLFQSTCPARGTTTMALYGLASEIISIHVPREGHDLQPQLRILQNQAFQSTCPARGTTPDIASSRDDAVFQSTCPARGTTFCNSWR